MFFELKPSDIHKILKFSIWVFFTILPRNPSKVLYNNLPLSPFQLEFLNSNRAQNIIWYNYDSLWNVSLLSFLLLYLYHYHFSYRQLINGIKKAKSVE